MRSSPRMPSIGASSFRACPQAATAAPRNAKEERASKLRKRSEVMEYSFVRRPRGDVGGRSLLVTAHRMPEGRWLAFATDVQRRATSKVSPKAWDGACNTRHFRAQRQNPPKQRD